MRLIKEFMDRSGFHDVLKVLPFHRKGSAIAHEHWEIVESFLMSVILGAGNCSGSAQLSYDEVIKDIFGWEKGMPSQSSLSRFFRKYAENHSDVIFSELQRWWFAQIPDRNLTLDIDSTVITRYGSQEGAEVGYNPTKKGRKSHHPLMAFVAEHRMVVNSWMRRGDVSSSAGFDQFLNQTLEMIPCSKIGLIRGDSGFSGNDILSHLELLNLDYIIAHPLRSTLVDEILDRKRWTRSSIKGISFCSVAYRAKTWGQARRVVIVRKDTHRLPNSGGKTLFAHQDDYLRYRYSAFVTNSKLSDELVWINYKHRAEAENQIKELKYDYALEGYSFSEIEATEFAFRWVTIAYNLMSHFRNTIEVSNVKHTLSTVRFNCIAIGAYLVTSGRQKKLMLAAQGKQRDYIQELFVRLSQFEPDIVESTA
jgi:hypothetical protein